MKTDFTTSLAAAVCLHAVFLVGLRAGSSARPQPIVTESDTVNVSFIDLPPAPATQPAPVTTEPPFRVPFEPQPAAQPPPDEPQPPAPAADMPPAFPAPMPSRDILPTAAIPATPAIPRHTRSRAPHSAPGRASELAHASSSGAPGELVHASGVPARALGNPRPIYPDAARRMRQQGVVMLDILVSADGAADNVTVTRSSGYPFLDRAAADAVRSWTFAPARSAGLPVASHVQLPVRFSLEE